MSEVDGASGRGEGQKRGREKVRAAPFFTCSLVAVLSMLSTSYSVSRVKRAGACIAVVNQGRAAMRGAVAKAGATEARLAADRGAVNSP